MQEHILELTQVITQAHTQATIQDLILERMLEIQYWQQRKMFLR